MERPFQSYAKYYDIIYSDKNYEMECNFLEEVFKRYSKLAPKTILDAGCGTGGHAFPLVKRGYEVTGIDSSEMMIRIAKEKSRKSGVKIVCHTLDLRELKLDRPFDACICMFSVMNYMTTNDDLKKALSSIRRHLKEDSLFVLDFWYGPAVLKILPSSRVKDIEKEGVRVIRFAKPSLDVRHHTCTIEYHVIAIKKESILDEVKETHIVRFLFPEEIKHYLEETGFELLKICRFPELNAEIKDDDWHAVAIARACAYDLHT